jgi:two-component system nitrate/nitrite response regulator NarL
MSAVPAERPSIELLLVTGSRLLRDGLVSGLSATDDCQVVATAFDGRQAVELAQSHAPDVVVIDLVGAPARDLTRAIHQVARRAKVIALGVTEAEGTVMPLIEAGLAGYVTAEGTLDDLVEIVRRAARGESMCSPRMVAMLLRRISVLAAEREPVTVATLTARELEIVSLIEDGLTNKEIAQRLCIQVPTVKNHVHHILGKLDVRRRADAAAKLRWQLSDERAV